MNISDLEFYVDQKNRWARLFGNEQLSLLNAEDRQKIAESIDCDMSPENLTCDGELPASQVQARYYFLQRCASELLSIDANVKFYEFN